MADADERAVILAYHEATKHSPVSVRTRAHYLDWDNRPFPFKFYTDLERIPLPEDIPSLDVPALEAIGVTSVLDPTPGPDIAALARLLVLGAGVHHTKTFRKGGVPHFRNYASAGACTRSRFTWAARTSRACPPACTTSTRRVRPSPP
jgi:hypothetical protein